MLSLRDLAAFASVTAFAGVICVATSLIGG